MYCKLSSDTRHVEWDSYSGIDVIEYSRKYITMEFLNHARGVAWDSYVAISVIELSKPH